MQFFFLITPPTPFTVLQISLSLSSSLLSEAKTEQYKDLRALLQLLSSLCSKDLVPFLLHFFDWDENFDHFIAY